MARFERAASSFQTRPSTRLTLHRDKLAYPEGFEPPLAVLETVVLPLTLEIHCLVPTPGNDPRSFDYQSNALPLSYAGIKLVLRERIELPSAVCNTAALPLDERSFKLNKGHNHCRLRPSRGSVDSAGLPF